MPNRTVPTLMGIAVAAALLVPAPAVEAADSVPAGVAPLRPLADCIDPGRVRSWTLLMDNRVLVDAGRRNYLINLRERCPELTHNPFLGFISNNPIGRVCGDIGDRLVPHGSASSGRPRCSIRSILVVSSDDYRRFLEQRSARTDDIQVQHVDAALDAATSCSTARENKTADRCG